MFINKFETTTKKAIEKKEAPMTFDFEPLWI